MSTHFVLLYVVLILPNHFLTALGEDEQWSCENYYCQINCAEEFPSGGYELEECERAQNECRCGNSGRGGASYGLVFISTLAALIIFVAVGAFFIYLCVYRCKDKNDREVTIDAADAYPANFPELEPVDLTRPVNYLRLIRLVEREPVLASELPPRYENTCTTSSSSIAIKIPNEDDVEEDSPPDYKSLYI